LVPMADKFVFADAERLAVVGFLAGYRDATRDAYRMDLRLFAAWCAQQDRALFDVQRVDIESYARQLEARGRARSTVARRLCTVAGFYRYAEQEGAGSSSRGFSSWWRTRWCGRSSGCPSSTWAEVGPLTPRDPGVGEPRYSTTNQLVPSCSMTMGGSVSGSVL
jgi:Phage integrase, N-terminal SAM-like domain